MLLIETLDLTGLWGNVIIRDEEMAQWVACPVCKCESHGASDEQYYVKDR